MQSADAYRLERRALAALNGRLHAEVWRLGRAADAPAVAAARHEIQANERRIRTIDHVLRIINA